MHVQPYLFFDGRTDEALAFYKKALGAQIGMLMRFKESPDPTNEGPMGKVDPEKVMHSEFKIGDTSIMASDGNCQGKPKFEGFSLTLNAKTEAEADKLFNALADGGEVRMPLTKTFFSPKFGMVADKFGVGWMVLVEQKS
jgi:PhnB protein